MLQPVAETTVERSDIIARCPLTGAYLGKSRAQYYLVIPGQVTRHWSRHKVADSEILERANKALMSPLNPDL